ncbi:hypothetical protein K438DRAFT_1764838 [Mycena galopus ATCC 62051]|nr:hypothetical protein K438DRAFT_1764838 [Mycena galopus ATCC 62051]
MCPLLLFLFLFARTHRLCVVLCHPPIAARLRHSASERHSFILCMMPPAPEINCTGTRCRPTSAGLRRVSGIMMRKRVGRPIGPGLAGCVDGVPERCFRVQSPASSDRIMSRHEIEEFPMNETSNEAVEYLLGMLGMKANGSAKGFEKCLSYGREFIRPEMKRAHRHMLGTRINWVCFCAVTTSKLGKNIPAASAMVHHGMYKYWYGVPLLARTQWRKSFAQAQSIYAPLVQYLLFDIKFKKLRLGKDVDCLVHLRDDGAVTRQLEDCCWLVRFREGRIGAEWDGWPHCVAHIELAVLLASWQSNTPLLFRDCKDQLLSRLETQTSGGPWIRPYILHLAFTMPLGVAEVAFSVITTLPTLIIVPPRDPTPIHMVLLGLQPYGWNSNGVVDLTSFDPVRFKRPGLIRPGDHVVACRKAGSPESEAARCIGDWWIVRFLAALNAAMILAAYIANYIALDDVDFVHHYAWLSCQIATLTVQFVLSLGRQLPVHPPQHISPRSEERLDKTVVEFAVATTSSQKCNESFRPARITRAALMKLIDAPADIIHTEYASVGEWFDLKGQGVTLDNNPLALGGLYLGAILANGKFVGLITLDEFSAHVTLEPSLLEWHHKFRNNEETSLPSRYTRPPPPRYPVWTHKAERLGVKDHQSQTIDAAGPNTQLEPYIARRIAPRTPTQDTAPIPGMPLRPPRPLPASLCRQVVYE